LESLNDQIVQLTGTRVRETIPDEALAGADEVVLVDLTPEALIVRLRAGKVYPRERVPAALNNFFKIENLTSPMVLRGQASDGSTAGGGSTSPVRGVVFQDARAPTRAEIVDSMITRYMSWR
jgi:Osmosensitive K+ channel His kinase sensor domain